MTTQVTTHDQTRPSPDTIRAGMTLAHWASVNPDAIGAVDGERVLTFRELNERVNQVARALRELGLVPDDKVVLAAHNSLEWAVAYLACDRLGIYFIPGNWHSTPDELAHLVSDSGAALLLCDDKTLEVARETVRSHVPSALLANIESGADEMAADLQALADAKDASDIEDPQSGALFIYTSGTTGRPKGVLRTREAYTNFLVNMLAPDKPGTPFGLMFEAGTDRSLITGPLYHSGPLNQGLVTPINYGVGFVVMRRWDELEFLRLVEEHSITHAHLVPIMFHRLFHKLSAEQRSAHRLDSLKTIFHGAAPCPPETKRAMIDWLGPVIVEYYGATEGGGTGTAIGSEEWLQHPASVGQVRPPGELRIAREDGAWASTDEVGRIYFKSHDSYPFEYFGDQAKTDRAYTKDREYYTIGDIGRIDAQGYLYLEDRDSNLIISGGVNIYPAEIEAVLLEHPQTTDVAVIGVPDPEWGESVLALVQWTGDPDSMEQELRSFAEHKLARFKIPTRFETVASLPRQDSGKLFKHRLREHHRSLAAAETSRSHT